MKYSGARIRSARPRGVYVAAGVGAVVVVLIAIALFLPLVGFLVATTASTAGLIPFPAITVTLVTLLCAVLVTGLLVVAALRRHAWLSWTLAVLAMLVALGATAFPLFAVAAGSADRAADIGPILADLWQRVTAAIG